MAQTPMLAAVARARGFGGIRPPAPAKLSKIWSDAAGRPVRWPSAGSSSRARADWDRAACIQRFAAWCLLFCLADISSLDKFNRQNNSTKPLLVAGAVN